MDKFKDIYALIKNLTIFDDNLWGAMKYNKTV